MAKKFTKAKGKDDKGQLEHNMPLIYVSVKAKTFMPTDVFKEVMVQTLEELNRNSFYEFEIIAVDTH